MLGLLGLNTYDGFDVLTAAGAKLELVLVI